MKPPYGFLRTDNPYYDYFDKGRVPLVSTLPELVRGENDETNEVYFFQIDLRRIQESQLIQVVDMIHELRGADRAELYNYFKSLGHIPCRANQLSHIISEVTI